MRIAVITNTLSTSGGAGQVAATYSRLLKEQGNEVRTWTARPEFEQLSQMSVFSRLAFHLSDLGSQDAVVKEILDWKPDVLLTHNLTGCGFGTPKKIQRVGIRWIHVLHDVQLVEPSGQIVYGESFSMLRAIWRWKWSVMRHFAAGEPNAVVSPTKWLLDFHKKFGWFGSIPATIIPNPISMSFPSAAADKLRRESSIEGGSMDPRMREDDKRVLYVGRVDADKGVQMLLAAWKKLKGVAGGLTVIGTGSLLETVRMQQIDGIELLGVQSNEQVREIMGESHVVVLPSLVMENQPTVLLEALASGCQIVASDVGGVRETLEGAGRIVEPGDVDALATAIREALEDTSLKDVTEILSHHNPQHCVQRLADVLKSNL